MAILKYKDSQGNYLPIIGYHVTQNEVVLTTGSSTTSVMSLNAATLELANKVSAVSYDTINKKITKTINGTTTDVVTVSLIKTDLNLNKSDVGLDNISALGCGYGVCSTAAATAAKEVSITGYQLVKNGFVSVLFENDVPANATLNVNGTGAKAIYYCGDPIVADVIKVGNTVTFCYDGTNYVISHPMKLNKVTIRTWSDAQKTTPTEAILYVTLPNGVSQQVRIDNSGIGILYSYDGTFTVSSLYSNLDISSFKVNDNTVVDIVVATTPFVDMGLPSGTFWARGNIVKDSQGNYSVGNPTDYGCYFSWGNIDGYYWNSDSDKENYNFNIQNWNNSPGGAITENIASNDAEHDAAVARLGGDWHMPTKDNFIELCNKSYCTWTWTAIDGINGYLITSKTNNNTLFIPAAGYRNVNYLNDRGSIGTYHSSVFSYVTYKQICSLWFTDTRQVPYNNVQAGGGFAFRAVL